MKIVSIVIVCGVIIAIWSLLRSAKKQRRGAVNRYRQTAPSRQEQKVKAKRNRYQRQSRRDLKQKTKPEPEPKREPEIQKKSDKTENIRPKKRAKIERIKRHSISNDPDVVLGLKEAPVSGRKKPIPTDAQITLKPAPPPPPIMMLHIIAPEGKPFTGYELLQAILSVNMRYGKHNIFHRHEAPTGEGAVLFSLASVVKPGTFDLPKMGSFTTPGLSLFFSADAHEDPLFVYELLLQTAGQLLEDLGGRVLDEKHQPLTPTSVVEHRRLLRAYLEGQQVPDLFDTIED